MSLSRFRWIVVYDDGETEEYIAETIEEIVFGMHDQQPRAIIKSTADIKAMRREWQLIQ